MSHIHESCQGTASHAQTILRNDYVNVRVTDQRGSIQKEETDDITVESGLSS
jgi:hypothetical protein